MLQLWICIYIIYIIKLHIKIRKDAIIELKNNIRKVLDMDEVRKIARCQEEIVSCIRCGRSKKRSIPCKN